MAIDFRTDGQPAKRRGMRFTDQHGRKWSGVIEIRSGYPIRVSPRFQAPLRVPPKYLKYDKEEPNLITIDYEGWVRDIESAHQRWNEHLRKGAIQFYGEKAPEAIKDPPAVLLNEVGQRPEPVEPVLAALSGNKWILGLSDNKPAWAETYFTTPVPKPESMSSEMEMDARAIALAAQFPDAEDEGVQEVELPNFGGARE